MIVIMNTNILFTMVPGIISKGYNILNHLFYKVQSSFKDFKFLYPFEGKYRIDAEQILSECWSNKTNTLRQLVYMLKTLITKMGSHWEREE